MKRTFPINLLLFFALLIGITSCSENTLGPKDYAGVYTAKKIGQNVTIPLTIFKTTDGRIEIETQWLSNGMQTVSAKLDDKKFSFNQEVWGEQIVGSGTFKKGTISIIYQAQGNTYRIIASQ
ncbi:hypothetical protein [Gracilimonas mengyeensis]|uniref:Uncharacterized protein n=1 Tax=Gracilimonas mengyeensis TaxID=1302730 RepID=A0A521BYJ7_9BACT|nr:hypothetical protein [Gracilimonas mengyeensis]SMO52268.1 hypothetical protein SAMN06265219_1048 [Gracilimonas mengyeensis]